MATTMKEDEKVYKGMRGAFQQMAAQPTAQTAVAPNPSAIPATDKIGAVPWAKSVRGAALSMNEQPMVPTQTVVAQEPTVQAPQPRTMREAFRQMAGQNVGIPVIASANTASPAPTRPVAQPSGMIPMRQAEQTNPAPPVNAAAGQAPGPGDTALSPIHARADSRTPPVAGGVPGGAFSVNLSPQDQQLKANLAKIDAMISGGVVPTPEQAQQIQELKQNAGFLRGGTDRRPVGPDGLPIKTGGAGMRVPGGITDTGLKIQFTKNVPDAVRREVMQPSGANDPAAQAARAKMHEQFLARNGYEQVDPVTGMTASEVKALPVAQRVELTKAKIGGMSAKGANEAAMANAKSNAEYRGGMLDAKGALLDAKMREMDLRGEMKDKEIASRSALKSQMSPSDEANVHKAIAEISFGGVNDNNVESINALRARLGQPPLIKAKVKGEVKYVPGAPSSTGNGAQAKASADDWLKDF